MIDQGQIVALVRHLSQRVAGPRRRLAALPASGAESCIQEPHSIVACSLHAVLSAMLRNSCIHALLVGESDAARMLADALRREGVAVERAGACLLTIRRRLIVDRDRTRRPCGRVMFIVFDDTTRSTPTGRLAALIDQLEAMTQIDAIIALTPAGQPSPGDAALGLSLYASDVAGVITILRSLTGSRSTDQFETAVTAHSRDDAGADRPHLRSTNDEHRCIGPRRSSTEPIQFHHCDEIGRKSVASIPESW